MANTSSAKKAARKAVRRTGINKARVSRMRSFLRKAEEAIEAGGTGAEAAFRAAQAEMMRAAQKGVIHKNTVSRKVSRLQARMRRSAS
jgi:small subunit ribosomal protein S20